MLISAQNYALNRSYIIKELNEFSESVTLNPVEKTLFKAVKCSQKFSSLLRSWKKHFVIKKVYERTVLFLTVPSQFIFFSPSPVLNALQCQFCPFSIHFLWRTSLCWNFNLSVLKAGTFSFQKTAWKAVLGLGFGPRVGWYYPDNSPNTHMETRASGTARVPPVPEFIWSKSLVWGWWYRWLLVFSGVTAREKRKKWKYFHSTFKACVFNVMRNEDN